MASNSPLTRNAEEKTMTYEVVLPSRITKVLRDGFTAILSVRERKASVSATDGYMAVICQVSHQGFPDEFVGVVDKNSLTKKHGLWHASVMPLEMRPGMPCFHQAAPKFVDNYEVVYLSTRLLSTLLLAITPFKGDGVYLLLDPKDTNKNVLFLNDHGTSAGILATRMPSDWDQNTVKELFMGLVRLSEETQP